MQFHRFDLNLLIALDILLREKNVTRAAERAHISQPAMSSALNKLRDFFGDPLLVRVGREMEITPRGQSLIEPVRDALARIQSALGTQPVFSPTSSRREFKIIVSEEAVPGLLPAVLKRIAQEAPKVSCRIELISQDSLSILEHGEADLCLCLDYARLYDVVEFPDTLRLARMRPVVWVCAVDANHPTVHDHLSVEQYWALPHVFGRPSGYRSTAEELVRRLFSIDLPVQLTVPSLLHLPLVLAGTSYVAMVPERVAHWLDGVVKVKTFPMPFTAPEHFEVLLWHQRMDLDPAHAWLRSLILDVAKTQS